MPETGGRVRRPRRRAGHSATGRTRVGRAGFVAWTFVETSLGAARENVAELSRVKLARHHRFALLGLLLCLPIGILVPSIWLDIAVVRDLLTADGDRPNVLGWMVIVGGLLLLPVAFVVALLPMTRTGPSRKRRLLTAIEPGQCFL